MSSPRRIPDLCFIAVFQQMTLNDQMNACEVNSRWYNLVRVSNLRRRFLFINCLGSTFNQYLESYTEHLSIECKPSMQILTSEDGEGSLYPKNIPLSKWNCLEMISPNLLNNAERIAFLFPSITDLRFANEHHLEYKQLLELLQHSNWKHKLTSFMLIELDWQFYPNISEELNNRLACAVNGLSSLKRLIGTFPPLFPVDELSIVSQLDVLSVIIVKTSIILRALERYARTNTALKVFIKTEPMKVVSRLNPLLYDRIVRLRDEQISAYTPDIVSSLCTNLPSLSTFNVYIAPIRAQQIFAQLSNLSRLVHLQFETHFSRNKPKVLDYHRPATALPSVKALDLEMTITSHSQVAWWSLPYVLPNLQSIHIFYFRCKACNINNDAIYSVNDSKKKRALRCLRALLSNLHSGVPLDRIILYTDFLMIDTCSAEKLLTNTPSN